MEVFQRFFERIVELCQAAGLVWGKELLFDATQVRANASVDSLVPRFYLRAKEHVNELFATDPTDSSSAEDESSVPSPELMAELQIPAADTAPRDLPWRATADERTQLAAANQGTWRLLEQRRLDPERTALHGYQRLSALRVSRTDPDAALMRLKGGGPNQRIRTIPASCASPAAFV